MTNNMTIVINENVSAVPEKKYMKLLMKDNYYKKDYCVYTAKAIHDGGQITGMSIRQLAAEIYTHAFIYYNFPELPDFIRNTALAKRIFNSASNGIDLEDNGDTLKRRICYSLIWAFC